MPTVAPYGTWRSPISAAVAASGAVRVGGLALDGEDVYWLEGRSSERGRNVIVRRRGSLIEDVTPPAFNVRSRAQEYGGGTFAVSNGTVLFCNDADQRIHRQDAGAPPRPLTPEGATRYADLIVDRPRDRLICVREDHGVAGEARTTVVTVPLAGGTPEVLAEGADFYSSPRLDPGGGRLAYLSWNHPQMPWQGTTLSVAEVAGDGRLGPPQRVAGGPSEAIFQPAWSPDGVLHFVSDRSGWWNLYRWQDGAITALCPMEAEFGTAAWVFGLSTYDWIDRATIACAYQQAGIWRLGLLDENGLVPVPLPVTDIGYLKTAAGRVAFIGASARDPAALWGLSASTGSPPTPARLHRLTPPAVEEDQLSRPEPVAFGTAGGATAYGLFYPPHNPAFSAPPGERPPLIVISHGGPTSSASTAFSLGLQFWSSRGFAVLDVNYRGSTGYGRAYRQALDGVWGVADVEDCAAGASHLVSRGLVDGARLAIRGGSAGGYTTLAALAFSDVFRAGASYYGVSDLEALAKDTHKFESRYLESLVGPYPARRDLYRARSPIHHTEKLSCPVIFFQGLEDKVVPPSQAEEMVAALERKGVPVEYVRFPEEQHGFRRAESITRALEAELAFYLRVFHISAA